MIRALHKQLNAELHFVTKTRYAELLKHSPYLEQVHTLESDINELTKDLKELAFDHVIDLHKNWRSKKLIRALGRKHSSYNKRSIDRWILVHLKIDRLKNQHIVDRYFTAVQFLNVKNDNAGLDLFFSDASQLPTELKEKDYAVVVIGTQHATKDIPEKLIVDTLDKLKVRIVLVGGKEHLDSGLKIEAESTCHILNYVGKTDLLTSAKIIEHAQYVIAPDTGMMHIAAALKKPLVAIYGSTSSKLGFTPYLAQIPFAIVENTSLSCRPCTKMGRDVCPKGHFNCMNELKSNTIVEKISSLID